MLINDNKWIDRSRGHRKSYYYQLKISHIGGVNANFSVTRANIKCRTCFRAQTMKEEDNGRIVRCDPEDSFVWWTK